MLTLILNKLKTPIALLITLLTFGFFMKRQGKLQEQKEQNEKATKIIAKQRDTNIDSVSDADKLFKDADDRN